MSVVNKQDILATVLTILDNYKEQISVNSCHNVGITLEFMHDNKLHMTVFMNTLDKTLYMHLKEISNDVKSSIFRNSIEVMEKYSGPNSSTSYLYGCMQKCIFKGQYKETRCLLFSYIRLVVTEDICNIMSTQPNVVVL